MARGWEGELGGVGGGTREGKGSREALAAERGVGRDLLDDLLGLEWDARTVDGQGALHVLLCGKVPVRQGGEEISGGMQVSYTELSSSIYPT